jgi:hypothetical protein
VPLYRIRLEDPESEHFRLVSARADTEEEAIALALRNEVKAVGFAYTPEQLAEEQAVPEEERTGKQRGNLHMHAQSQPFRLVRVNGREISAKVREQFETAYAPQVQAAARKAAAIANPDADADDGEG